MTTYDLSEVKGFVADLNERMTRCDNGEGMECATLDDSLRHYAGLCREFREGVREWGRTVFSGRIAFDPEVERVLKAEGGQLCLRAQELLGCSRSAEGSCYILDAQPLLSSAVSELNQLLTNWVSPRLSVGPSARITLPFDAEAMDAIRKRLASLPPLPADWMPSDPEQQRQFKKIRGH